jgi:RHS repeat-associated protein
MDFKETRIRRTPFLDRATNIAYRTSTGDLIRSLDYQYDALGMITNKTVSGGSGSISAAYEYDSINRLIREDSGDSWAEYSYDLAGNRTAVIQNSATNLYTMGVGDRLASWGVNGAAQYNAAGCITSLTFNDGSNRSLQWNEKYQLTSVSSVSSVVNYSYDVLNRRVSRTDGANMERYVYDGNYVVADADASGNVLRTYTYGPGVDNILAMTVHGASTNTYFHLKDHQNSVIALVDQNGSVVERYTYSAYGETTIFDSTGNELTESAYGNRYLWQGREFDSTTGLYFFRARWYSPETGRWISKDPIGISGGLNQYVFCGNNPVNFVDPLGLWTVQLGVSSAAGTVGGGASGFGLAISHSDGAGLLNGWQVGSYGTAGGGAFVGSGGSLTVDLTLSRNNSIHDLAGTATTSGGSFGEWLVGGFEANVPTSKDVLESVTFSFGFGAGPSPIEGHVFRTTTDIRQWNKEPCK